MTSNNSDPIQTSSTCTPLALGCTMSSQSTQLRRPSHVQTNFYTQYPTATPASAISASSVASNSQQNSPLLSPDPTLLTTNSSVQPSPDPMRPRDEDQCPPGFQLPESIISRQASAASLGHSWTRSPSPMAEAVLSNSGAAAANAPTPNNNKGNIIRRLSNRASRRITGKRRQSSAAPSSRDASIGPCILRRRSDSNTTVPPEFGIASTDSESDLDDRDEMVSLFRSVNYLDGPSRDSSANSTVGSISGISNTMAGPVIPPQLQRGTWVRKISKKKRVRRVCLVYDPETNRISWDRARPQKFLHVDEVREIRTGTDIQQYGRDFNIPEAERSTWFSILYSVPEKSKATKFLHLIADDFETYHMWTTFLDAMLRYRQEVMTSLMTFNEKAVAQYWQTEMMKNHSEDEEELDITAVMRICQNLHIYSSQATLQSNFRLADSRRCERLDFSEFMEFVRLMRQRRDVQRIMQRIADRPEVGITLDEFLTFLRDTQGEDVEAKRSTWEKLFTKFVRKYRNDEAGMADLVDLSIMSEDAFVGFLSSRHNMAVDEEPLDFTLDRPMNEYFISSSHNTYLLGRQVAGQSSIEGYISALVRGCRCVEVDCWDGADGQPLVLHGHTLTSSISFKEVMTTINKYAFVKSSFPLWISLEVHCSPTQQALMTEIMKEAFGARLVTEPLDPRSTKLPSPSELMERVLIKVKQPRIMKDEPATGEFFSGRKRGNSLTSPLTRPTIPDPHASQSLPQSPLLTPSNPGRRPVGKNRVNTITEGEVQELSSNGSSDTESGSEMGSVTSNIMPVLGKLGVYCSGLRFSGFDAPAAKRFNHIFSFMEASFAKNSRTKEDKMLLDIHNMRYLMRVYPDGTRVASGNFDPLTYWRRGVQMAALNWQTFDFGLQLNQAMFEGGMDSSGYVLKPAELRDIQVRPYNSAIAEGMKERSVVSFSIDVLSAQHLMRPAKLSANKQLAFYVDVEVFHANDKRDKTEKGPNVTHEPDSPLRFRTEVIRENGFNPVFSNGRFRFKVTTKHPELIFVRWTIRLSKDGESYSDKERKAMATYTAKLTNLRQGYRTLPLLNYAGEQYLFSSLFCKIKVESIEKKLIAIPRQVQEGGNKLNRLGGKVFGRSNTSPRSTVERSSMEKHSFEG